MPLTLALAALLSLQWLDALLHLPATGWAARAALVMALAAGVPALTGPVRLFALGLAALCAAALWGGAPAGLLVGALASAAALAAFLLAMQLFKTLLDLMPSVQAMRDSLRRAAPEDRGGLAVLVATLLGGVMSVGALAVVVPLFSDAGSADRGRGAALAVRGVALAAAWSPFTASVALVATLFEPRVLYGVMLGGATIAALGLGAGVLMGDFALRPGALGRLARQMARVLAPAGLLVATVLAGAQGTGRPVPDIAVLVLCPLTALALTLAPAGARRQAIARLTGSLRPFANDLTLFSLAIVLAALTLGLPGLGATLAEALGSGRPGAGLLLGAALLVALLPLAGVHMILPATLVLSVLATNAGLGGAGLVTAVLLVLLGWSVGANVGSASIALMTAARLFETPRAAILRDRATIHNLGFAAIVAAALVLTYRITG